MTNGICQYQSPTISATIRNWAITTAAVSVACSAIFVAHVMYRRMETILTALTLGQTLDAKIEKIADAQKLQGEEIQRFINPKRKGKGK